MGIMADARTQLENALGDWDWTNYFPGDYDSTLVKGVQITADWPSDQIKNIEVWLNGMLIKPVVSVVAMSPERGHAGDGFSLGNVIDFGVVAGKTRYGQTFNVSFQVDCWADLQTGQGPQAELIADGVYDCLFVNQNALASYRHLCVHGRGGRLIADDGSQLWRVPLIVEGRIVQSYDA